MYYITRISSICAPAPQAGGETESDCGAAAVHRPPAPTGSPARPAEPITLLPCSPAGLAPNATAPTKWLCSRPKSRPKPRHDRQTGRCLAWDAAGVGDRQPRFSADARTAAITDRRREIRLDTHLQRRMVPTRSAEASWVPAE
eukprot:CAMPEP_0206020526 /NCGR_PEP_ID=MMETSP1464-20131121/31220_1 /ASSEMBLY_ACC=CAM_ASM_001124 /TAXON_ID=119497 /ORGANISM="Exanthemachrysis gayraliae, Strain RCC1523" /LENGTH=142 /DNA_ID=CAMNT_0053394461 /DNA_START=51 /DNA_END=476 /DNA_ORIENTATION=-